MAQDALVPNTLGPGLANLIADTTVYIAVGAGLSAWDGEPVTPQPTIDQTTLNNELARVVATVEYLNDEGQVSATPTRTIQATAEFPVGVANGTIREHAMFILGTGSADSGFAAGLANHPAVSKPAGAEDYVLTRKMRLTLQG